MQLHLLLVRHAACPEHGELIHKGDSAHELSVPAIDKAERAASWRAGTTSAPESDEHCSVSGHRREYMEIAVFGGTDGPTEASSVLISSFALAFTPGSRSRYELAPKTSPPAV